jgi:hypothetical protein
MGKGVSKAQQKIFSKNKVHVEIENKLQKNDKNPMSGFFLGSVFFYRVLARGPKTKHAGP